MPNPIQPSSAPDVRSVGLRFWRSFAASDEDACRDALQTLKDIWGGTSEAYSDFTASSESSFGTFVKIILPEKSPKNAKDAWNSTKSTSLVRVAPQSHCLAFDGDVSKYSSDGGAFVACGLLKGQDLHPDSCTTGTHRTPDRPRFELPSPAYVVKVKPSNPSVRTKVLAGAYLLETELPSEVKGSDSPFISLLENLEAPPLIWKLVLELYPGRESIKAMYQQAAFSRLDTEEPLVEDASASQMTSPSQSRLRVDTTRTSWANNTPVGDTDLDNALIGTVLRTNPPLPHSSRVERNYPDHVVSRFGQDGTFLPFSSENPPFGDENSIALSSIRSNLQPPEWRPHFNKLSKTVKRNDEEVRVRFNHLDLQLDTDFKFVSDELNSVRALASKAEEEAGRANTRLDNDDFDSRFTAAATRFGFTQQATSRSPPRTSTPPPVFNWSGLTNTDKTDIITAVIKNLDIEELGTIVSRHLNLESIQESVELQNTRLVTVEREFTREQGAIPRLQAAVDDLVARKNVSAVERAGYIFNGPEDCEALIAAVGPNAKICTKCLDLYGVLTLSQDPYVTYESAIKVHADANKANFDGVAESRIKLSFSVPYPEVIVRTVETAATAAHGGAKWAPMFATPDVFEDNFRDGAHRRVMKGIDRAYELVSRSVDQTFPVSQRAGESPTVRKVHTILTEQNRLAYRQTIGFIECLMPFYRTLMGGSMSKEEAWDRVFVFVLEFLTSVQEERVLAATDVSNEAQMMWACFKATDHVEEFRKAKFIEHTKALSILALTTLEREAKAMQSLEDRAKKLIETANNAKITRLETRMQTAENKLKSIVTKNPDLK